MVLSAARALPFREAAKVGRGAAGGLRAQEAGGPVGEVSLRDGAATRPLGPDTPEMKDTAAAGGSAEI